jgi:hypothetical protein
MNRSLTHKISNTSSIHIRNISLNRKYSSSIIGSNPYFTFQFDSVFNESHKQEKFYSAVVRPTIRSFIEGENACVILFGPTEGGKTHTLKGKTGIERGILPRAVEDIFNIVRNSEERDDDYELIRNEINEYDLYNDQ